MKKQLLLFLVIAPIISAAFVLAPLVPKAGHINISSIVSEYTGAESCIGCHSSGSSIDVEAHARQIVQTNHFAFKIDVGTDRVFEYDGDDDLSNDVGLTGVYGKSNRYCGLPGAITANNWIGLWQDPSPPFNNENPAYPTGLPGGCSRCHIGNGTLMLSELGGEDAWKTVDCLLCHAEVYQVDGMPLPHYGARKAVRDTTTSTGFHMPYISGEDLKVTSESIISKPTTNNCQNCHVMAGGGYTNKRGHDYDGGHGDGLTDIHSTSVSCVDCHITKEHKIGAGRPKPAVWPNDLHDDPDNDKIDCGYCHTSEGQAYFTEMTIPIPAHDLWGTEARDKHLDNIACQTCHIKNNLGLDMKWFDQLVQEKDGDGNFMRWKPKGHKLSGEATLLYKWYNGTVYDNVKPRGEMGDGKIHPFREMKSYVPVDDATGIFLPLKLGLIFNANPEISNLTDGFGVAAGDTMALIEKAIRIGVKTAAVADPDTYGVLVDESGDYTGTYSYEWDEMNFSVDHGTTPASEALSCEACHSETGGRLDWEALGYDGDPMLSLAVENRMVDLNSGLRKIYPNPVTETASIEYSITRRGHVDLSIFSSNGQLVETIISFEQAPGTYTLTLNAGSYPGGIYTCRLSTPSGVYSSLFEVMR